VNLARAAVLPLRFARVLIAAIYPDAITLVAALLRVPAKSLGDAEQAHSTVCGSTADGMAGSGVGRAFGRRAANAQKKGVAAAEVASMDLSGFGFGCVVAVAALGRKWWRLCCRAGAVATKGRHHCVVGDPWEPVVTGERATS
jgi:hypothetical protein